jgi:hypothetical protein
MFQNSLPPKNRWIELLKKKSSIHFIVVLTFFFPLWIVQNVSKFYLNFRLDSNLICFRCIYHFNVFSLMSLNFLLFSKFNKFHTGLYYYPIKMLTTAGAHSPILFPLIFDLNVVVIGFLLSMENCYILYLLYCCQVIYISICYMNVYISHEREKMDVDSVK